MALRLHAITLADAPHHTGTHPAAAPATDGNGTATQNETIVVPFRDLVAVVTEQRNFVLDEATPSEMDRHRAIVDAAFHRSAVLPAPVGALFRSPDVLKRWMELHYVSLNDALEFVEEREVARVHIVRADGRDEDLEAGSDLAAAAAESFRALRRRAVAAVPLRLEEITGLVLSAAFLVERDLWKDFLSAVDEQQDAHRLLRFDVTGPWAPYDFVRMQFGG